MESIKTSETVNDSNNNTGMSQMSGNRTITKKTRLIIETSDLKIGYSGEEHFPRISTRIYESEFIVLLGRNGIGKSTLLKTLAGLQTVLGGKLNLMGCSINKYKPNQKSKLVSYVSTERIKVRDMTVTDLIALGRYSHTDWLGKPSESDRQAVDEALQAAGVAHLADKNANALSDGELQRCMIARTLAQDTPLIILDEPTAFLDLPNKFEIMYMLRNLTSMKGKTILLSTHDLDVAVRMADKLWVMSHNGLTEGAPEDFPVQKALSELFEGTAFYFDYDRGILTYNKSEKQIITFCGCDEDTTFALEKALQRLGYKPVKDNAYPLIRARKASDKLVFEYQNEDLYLDFGSIYELCTFLKLKNFNT